MGLLGKAVGNAARAGNAMIGGPLGTRNFLGAVGAAKLLSEHPFATTAAALGAYSIYAHSSNAVQAIPRGPAISEVAPGQTAQRSNFDLGASGDLVFALNRLNH